MYTWTHCGDISHCTYRYTHAQRTRTHPPTRGTPGGRERASRVVIIPTGDFPPCRSRLSPWSSVASMLVSRQRPYVALSSTYGQLCYPYTALVVRGCTGLLGPLVESSVNGINSCHEYPYMGVGYSFRVCTFCTGRVQFTCESGRDVAGLASGL